MTSDTVLFLARQALETILWICGPSLVAGLIIGITISIFQVATSIQDPNLSTLPRIVVMTLVLFLTMPAILNTMIRYTVAIFESIPKFAR
jgi:flagellar biosynthesis protein FliQ